MSQAKQMQQNRSSCVLDVGISKMMLKLVELKSLCPINRSFFRTLAHPQVIKIDNHEHMPHIQIKIKKVARGRQKVLF